MGEETRPAGLSALIKQNYGGIKQKVCGVRAKGTPRSAGMGSRAKMCGRNKVHARVSWIPIVWRWERVRHGE